MTPPMMKNVIFMQGPMKFCDKFYNLVQYIRLSKGVVKVGNGWAWCLSLQKFTRQKIQELGVSSSCKTFKPCKNSKFQGLTSMMAMVIVL
jgi:hypothetical protein